MITIADIVSVFFSFVFFFLAAVFPSSTLCFAESRPASEQIVFFDQVIPCFSCRQIDYQRCEVFESAIWREISCQEIFEGYVLEKGSNLPIAAAYSCFTASQMGLAAATRCGEFLLADSLGRRLIENDALKVVSRFFSRLIAALVRVPIPQETIGQLLSAGSGLPVEQREELFQVMGQVSGDELNLFLSGLSREESSFYSGLYSIGNFGATGEKAEARIENRTEEEDQSESKGVASISGRPYYKLVFILAGLVTIIILSCCFSGRCIRGCLRLVEKVRGRGFRANWDSQGARAEAHAELLAYFDLSADATPDMLKRRYYSLARKIHPDVPGNSKEAFVELSDKYKQARIALGEGDSDD